MTRKLMMNLVAIIAMSVASGGASNRMPTAHELEQRVLSSRRAITRGHFILKSQGREGDTPVSCNWEIRIDHSRRRGDMTANDMSPRGVQQASFRQVSCFGDKDHYFFSDRVPNGGGQLCVVVQNRDAASEQPPLLIPEPRMLGLVPLDFVTMQSSHSESFIGAADRGEPLLTRDTQRSMDCWRISYTKRNGVSVRFWIASELGESIVRIEQHFSMQSRANSHTDVIDFVDCEVAKHGPSGMWFPTSCFYQRVEGGNRVTREEKLAIEVVSLNEPLDSDLFTLAALGIPSGRRVAMLGRPAESLLWNGSEIVAAQAEKPSILEVAQRESRSRQIYIYSTISVITAFVAAVLVWRFMSARG